MRARGGGEKEDEEGFQGCFGEGGWGEFGDESEVVKGEDGRVGIRLVAFAGVGWK